MVLECVFLKKKFAFIQTHKPFFKPPIPPAHLFLSSQMWPTCCSAVQRVENLSKCLSSSSCLANISRSFSPPVASAVIDMPPAINQRSSRAEQRPLSERTGLAALEKRVREGELIQLSPQESPTPHHFTSFFLMTPNSSQDSCHC